MDCAFILLLGCLISWTPVITLGGIALMPNTSLNCPGPIQFTCVGTDIPNTLIWRVRVNDTDHRGEYAFLLSHNFPRSIPLNPPLPGVEVLVINVSISNQFRINIASTLTSAAMLLNEATIQCADGANVNSTVYRIDIIAPPTHPFLECSLVVSPGGVIVSFDSFSSGNNVTNYRVVLSPTPSSCPSEQLVSPSEDYSCSGLVLGTRYSFNVSAIYCGNQEGPGSTIIVQPQVPMIPEIVIFSTYNDENSLSQLTVIWQVKHLSISDVCSFDNSLNYSIFLENGRGGRLEERVVNSDSCNNDLCSTSFNTLSSSNQSYLVTIHAVNVFGQSNTAESASIGNSLQSEVLSLALTFEDCITTLLCSSVLAEGPCIIQYGLDSSYENFDNHLNVSLNSPSPLPLIDALTQYYFQVEVSVNFTIYRSRRSLTTGEFATRLTDTNIGLLIVGVIFLILGIISFIVWIRLFIKYNTARTKHVWIVILLVLWLVPVCLWIAVGAVVGPQKNTCDSKWQSNRDNLIIAAFVLSFVSLLLFVCVITIAVVAICKKAKSQSPEETSHARDHPNLISNGTEKGSDGNRDGTTEQPQQKNKDEELDDDVEQRLHKEPPKAGIAAGVATVVIGGVNAGDAGGLTAGVVAGVTGVAAGVISGVNAAAARGVAAGVAAGVTGVAAGVAAGVAGVAVGFNAGVTGITEGSRNPPNPPDSSTTRPSPPNPPDSNTTGPDVIPHNPDPVAHTPKNPQEITATPALLGAKEPEWDIESDVCCACTTKVTSESRNNCRACGKVVCKKCSKSKAYVQYIGNIVMVCSHCHKESKKKGDLHMKSNAEETTV